MKAAILVETSQPLQILDGVKNRPLKNGQLKVKLFYSGVCYSQVMEWKGARGPDRFLPHLLGHEATGEVIEAHASVTKVKVGDKIVLGWIKGEGIEAGGAQFDHEKLGVINSGGVTTFSTETVVSENRVVKLPASVQLDEGVLYGCALLTGAGMVLNQARPAKGSKIAVIGLGGIGLSSLIAAQNSLPSILLAIDVSEEKLSLSKKFGATHTLNSTDPDFKKKALAIVSPLDGFDFVFEAAGRVSTIEDAFSLTRTRGGECIFASHPPEGEKIKIEPHHLHLGKKISGSWGGLSQPDRDIPLLAKLIESKKIPIREMISGPFKLEKINEVLRDLGAGKLGRPVIELNDSH